MKKITIIIFIILMITLFYTEDFNKIDESKMPIIPIITIKSTGEEISPKYYEEGFDFKYEDIPTLEFEGDEDMIEISSLNNFPTIVHVGEHYYEYTEYTGNIHKKTYELDKDSKNTVSFSLARRSKVKDEQAIYYLSNGEGKYVFRIRLIIDKTS